MPRTCRPLNLRKSQGSEQASLRAGAATVASLGMQVRLVPIGVDRNRELASLIQACETLRAEQEHLFQQIIGVLSDDSQHGADDHLPSPSCKK